MRQDVLAGKMLLLLHDPFTGRPLAAARLLRSALAATALADLALRGLAVVEGSNVVVAPPSRPGIDPVTAWVIDTISQQRAACSVLRWVQVLADPLYDLLTERAVSEGIVRRERGWLGVTGRKPDRFPACIRPHHPEDLL